MKWMKRILKATEVGNPFLHVVPPPIVEIERLRAELAAMREQRDEAHGLIRKWRLNLVEVVEAGEYMDAMTSEARIKMDAADKRAFLAATCKEGGGA